MEWQVGYVRVCRGMEKNMETTPSHIYCWELYWNDYEDPFLHSSLIRDQRVAGTYQEQHHVSPKLKKP